MPYWIVPAVISTLMASLIIVFSYGYMYLKEREKALGYFFLAWLVYCIRYILKLLALKTGNTVLFEILIGFIASLNYVFLYLGITFFLDGKRYKAVNLFIILSPIITLLLPLFSEQRFLFTLIVFFISASIYVYLGFCLLFMKNRFYHMRIFVGIVYILWGIHKYNYPFLKDHAGFAPIGYLLGSFMALLAAIGIIMLHYEVKKTAYEKNENRLSSLVKIQKINDSKTILDTALHIAIDITESQYGFIYRYNEDSQIFTLNTWSKEVHKDCSIMEPKTQYSLDKTGCWGEVVRQRKPFMLNQYSKNNPFVKGTPEGHVPIKRFLSIPVIRDGHIVATLGVANKTSDYHFADIRQMSLLMNQTWSIIEQKEFQEELIKAKEKAEESNRLKSSFMANLSHEIRTPMNGILGFANLVMDKETTAEDRKIFYRNLDNCCDRLVKTIEDLVSISMIDSGQVTLKEQSISLSEMMTNLIDSYKDRIKDKGLDFDYTFPEKDVTFKGDEGILFSILDHLLDNAYKFTPEGKIVFQCQHQEESLIFTIEDSGIGISDDMKETVFNPFFQVDNKLTRSVEGNGLGLSIVDSFVKVIGGDLDLQSRIRDDENNISGGTTVRLKITL